MIPAEKHPPKWSTAFFKWFCNQDFYEDLQGDLHEEFQLKTQSTTKTRASLWYSWQILRLFRPSMIKNIKTQNSIERELTMIKNYLKIGIRNLVKYKAATSINVVGLSTGLAAFILIALFVKDEFSYDRHFEGVEDIYRVTVKNFTRDGDMSRQWAFASAGHADRLKEDYPDITHSVRFYPWVFPDIEFKEQRFPGEQVIFASQDVFDVFSFKFLYGNPETAFSDLTNLVLTDEMAVKIFGNDWEDQDILDKSVTISRSGQSGTFKITGVIENMPDQQHFHFDYLAPIRFLEMIFTENQMNNVGGNYNWLTYVRVAPDTDILALTNKANDEFWDKYIGTFQNGGKARDFFDFHLQPILDIHLNSNLEGEYETNGSMEQVIIFSIVGLLLLMVACVNYMNLATSHYSRRMKEVGVRKVVGAFRTELVKQFLIESTLITVVSLPIAIGLVYWFLPSLNNFMEKSLVFNPLVQYELLGGILLLMLIVGFLAGLYPALFLSKMNLVQALKGEQSMNAKKWNFRSWLVTFQYAVTIALIFTILIIESQMKFIQNSNAGYEREQLLHINLTRNISNLDVFKREIMDHPSISAGTYASRVPTGRLMDNKGSQFYQGDSLVNLNFRLPFIRVDEDFLSTFEIPLIAGSDFTRDQDMSRDSVGYYLINRTAAKALGFDDPNEIIGRRLSYGNYNGQRQSNGSTRRIGRILGVTEDFHFESLHSEIVPMVMLKDVSSNRMRRIVLKVDPNDFENTLKHVENTWAGFDPVNTVNYRFLDDMFNDQYEAEQRLSTMIKAFTIIAILIGCLGLIGMVGFIIETKLKEIGIRKVLGATTKSIWMMVSQRFLILIAIAFIIATPLTYWLMDGWLQNFVYRTTISIDLFALPVLLAVLLTLLAISYQTIKASRVNPVECLKDE